MIREVQLSASAISTLKECPVLYRNMYVLGVRRIVKPDSLRIGVNWHDGQEIIHLKPGQLCPKCSQKKEADVKCFLCCGSGHVDSCEDAMARLFNSRYNNLYPWMDKRAAEVERAVIVTSLYSYIYNYESLKDNKYNIIASEIPFKMPLVDPRTGHAVPGVIVQGVIDKIVRNKKTNVVSVMEHKSTSCDLAPDSDYWGHLRLDTQTMLYVYAARRLQADGLLVAYGIKETDPPIDEVLYDVWRKPSIKPKMLSQKDTATLIEEGTYFGQEFDVTWAGPSKQGEEDLPAMLIIDGTEYKDNGTSGLVMLKSNKPTIRETPDMFAARLFNDYGERPERHFARRVANHDDDKMAAFEWELYHEFQAVQNFTERGCWYHNEHACDRFGTCDYAQFCYTGKEINLKKPPVGFECIFNRKDG